MAYSCHSTHNMMVETKRQRLADPEPPEPFISLPVKARWNESNLDTEGVTLVDPTATKRVFRVHRDHPMLAMLRANWQALGVSISTEQWHSSGGVYYHVSGNTFDYCLHTLRPLLVSYGGYARLSVTTNNIVEA